MKTARRPLAAVLATLLGLLAAFALLAVPAAAHGGEGEMQVTSTTREGDDVTVTVRLIYIEDGHGVPDATVTVVVDDSTPVPMEPGAEEGDYTATVPAAPGEAIRVTSVEPATTAQTTAPDEDLPPASPTSEAATSTEAPTTTAADDDAESAAAGDNTPVPDDTGSDDGGGGSTALIAIGAVVVLAAAGAAAVILRKKPSDDSAGA